MPYDPHRWRPAPWVTRREAGSLLPWLRHEGSLVRALEQACRAPVRVRVIGEARRRPRAWELGYGADAARCRALIREVLLEADGRPLVFAHSVLPLAALTGPLRRVQRLGTRPLGAFLFGHPGAQRTALEATRLDPDTPLHGRAVRACRRPLPPLWARRSTYRVDGPSLRVTEVFLQEPTP